MRIRITKLDTSLSRTLLTHFHLSFSMTESKLHFMTKSYITMNRISNLSIHQLHFCHDITRGVGVYMRVRVWMNVGVIRRLSWLMIVFSRDKSPNRMGQITKENVCRILSTQILGLCFWCRRLSTNSIPSKKTFENIIVYFNVLISLSYITE